VLSYAPQNTKQTLKTRPIMETQGHEHLMPMKPLSTILT